MVDMRYDIYLNNPDNSVRFLLGKSGKKELVVFGVNPSTADQNTPDPTITKVERFAIKLGFDGFIMINVYPLRATFPADLPVINDEYLCRQNIEVIQSCFRHRPKLPIWAAWGNAIDVRSYLFQCLAEINEMLKPLKPEWFCFGGPTRSGNPRHPSRLAYNQEFGCFDIDFYLRTKETKPQARNLRKSLVHS